MSILINPPSWIMDIYIAVIFFVSGQVLIRKSFTNNNDSQSVAIAFGTAFGIAAITFLFISNSIKSPLFNNQNMTLQLISATIAGALFFIGNLFWIRSISSKKPLGNIRVVMAGVETFILFFIGFILFKEIITIKQILGAALILSGIHIFAS